MSIQILFVILTVHVFKVLYNFRPFRHTLRIHPFLSFFSPSFLFPSVSAPLYPLQSGNHHLQLQSPPPSQVQTTIYYLLSFQKAKTYKYYLVIVFRPFRHNSNKTHYCYLVLTSSSFTSGSRGSGTF